VRAALWVGIYYYGAGEEESSLEYFERARHNARDPELVARAEFWCDQVRLRTGREPLPSEENRGRGVFRALQALVRVDRSIREGRRSEAEAELLSIEGETRRAGLLGPYLARWGDLLRMPGSGRVNRAVLDPLLDAGAALPERLRLAVPAPIVSPASPEAWSLQFGAFLDPENAAAQVREFRGKGLDLRTDETVEDGRAWFRTRFGRFTTRAAAESSEAGLGLPAGTPRGIVRLQ
jgi:tetratricopeptide (TPR) repeat protein